MIISFNRGKVQSKRVRELEQSPKSQMQQTQKAMKVIKEFTLFDK